MFFYFVIGYFFYVVFLLLVVNNRFLGVRIWLVYFDLRCRVRVVKIREENKIVIGIVCFWVGWIFENMFVYMGELEYLGFKCYDKFCVI